MPKSTRRAAASGPTAPTARCATASNRAPRAPKCSSSSPRRRSPATRASALAARLRPTSATNTRSRCSLRTPGGWLNPWGAELRSEIQAGKNRGPRRVLPAPRPGLRLVRQSELRVLGLALQRLTKTVRPSARYKNETSTARSGLGYSIERLGYARVAAGYFSQASHPARSGVTDLSTPEVESPVRERRASARHARQRQLSDQGLPLRPAGPAHLRHGRSRLQEHL